MAKANGAEEGDEGAGGPAGFESKLVNVLALLLVNGRKQPEQIALLGRAGFRAGEIAVLLGTTRNTVSVQLSNQKRAREGTREKKASK